MNRLIATSVLLASLAVLPAATRAQDESYAAGNDAVPDAPAPSWTPPPPAEAPSAPEAQPQPAPPGQWVYTQQYGWIWMPYADAYTHVPADGWGVPYAYVYYPAYASWTWIAAPWVWGVGPWPVFGVWGPARFAWYGHGWWRSPARWHYAPARAWYPGGGYRAYRGGAVWAPQRAVPFRGGAGVWRGGGAGVGHGGGGMGRGGGHAAVRHGGRGRW